VRMPRPDDPTWRRVRQAQIPIGMCGVGLGVWQAVSGQVLLGLVVVTISVTAAVLAVTRLRSSRL
jgi:hypothetical protein